MIIKSIKLFWFVLLICFNYSLYCQKDDKISDSSKEINSIYFESSSLFKCNIKLPSEYNPQKKNKLVIGLHGGGGNLDRFITIWDSLDNINFIYAVPQAPYHWLMDQEIGYDWALWPTGNKDLINRASNLIENYLNDLIVYLKSRFNIGSVYLFGFSQGAIFTYITGMKNHNLYKGVIIHSGPGLLEPLISRFTEEAENNWLDEKYIRVAKNLRVFVVHGTNDKMANFELGKKSYDVLLENGYDVTFKKFIGGHSINNNMLKKINEWLKEEP